jgi:transposase-like protein
MNGGLTLERKQSNVKIVFQNILSTLERSRTYGYTRSTSFNWRIHLREGGAPQRRFFSIKDNKLVLECFEITNM